MEGNTKSNRLNPNRLWHYRKRSQLGQKQLAYLMGYRTATHISELEKGSREPELENIIKLELILSAPIHVMYPELTNRLRSEIFGRKQKFDIFKDSQVI